MSNVLDAALELTRPAGRRAAQRFLAEGPHLVGEALAAAAGIDDLFVSFESGADGEIAELVRRAIDADVRVHRISARQMLRLADTETPQGVIAVVQMPAGPDDPFAVSVQQAGARAGAHAAAPPLWLLLDGIQDPGNVGTLLRSADAFGVRGVIAGPGTADLWSGKVLRGAQGSHFRLALLAGDVAPHLDAFARAGGTVWAATKDGASVYDAPAPAGPTVLALGSEARGLSDEVLARAARRVAVPQRGGAESLNVAMAGSIILSWMSEPRRAAPPRGDAR